MYCKKCGYPNAEGAAFCTECGAALEQPEHAKQEDAAYAAQTANQGAGAAESETTHSGAEAGDHAGWGGYAGGLSPDEERLIGEKLEYYAPRFAQMRTGAKISWNWCSFFVFPAWAIYRKMYKECIIYVVAEELLSLALGSIYPGLFISILLGMFGNYLYLRSVSAHAVEMTSMPQVQKDAYAVKFGGVKSTNVWLLLLALLVWSLLEGLLKIG